MLLKSTDHDRIARAVAAAEATTRGEIVCVVTDQAAPYAEVPLAWAAMGALVLPLLVLALASAAQGLELAIGPVSAAYEILRAPVLATPVGYALLQAGLFLGVFALASVPSLRRRLIPLSLKRARVRDRALEQFHATGLGHTRERTGVLIFVSLYEQRAEVIADPGVSAQVEDAAWAMVVADLVAGVRAGRAADGFVAAIERCGRLLAEPFPAGPDNPNERPDALVEAPSA
jgi:putative membrane protein